MIRKNRIHRYQKIQDDLHRMYVLIEEEEIRELGVVKASGTVAFCKDITCDQCMFVGSEDCAEAMRHWLSEPVPVFVPLPRTRRVRHYYDESEPEECRNTENLQQSE